VTNFASITQQEIIRLLDSYDALVVRDLLIKEYGYVPLEGSGLSENGAYFIHPFDWLKSDIDSGKLCWPAMKNEGLQFIGLNGPNDIRFYDGLLKGKPCELKFVSPSTNPLTEKTLLSNLKKNALRANSQGAEVVITVISNIVKYDDFDWDLIHDRIQGTIETQYSNLKKIIILFENE
jgi:hypothetical protein